jgi:hypothetical protein
VYFILGVLVYYHGDSNSTKLPSTHVARTK